MVEDSPWLDLTLAQPGKSQAMVLGHLPFPTLVSILWVLALWLMPLPLVDTGDPLQTHRPTPELLLSRDPQVSRAGKTRNTVNSDHHKIKVPLIMEMSTAESLTTTVTPSFITLEILRSFSLQGSGR